MYFQIRAHDVTFLKEYFLEKVVGDPTLGTTAIKA